MFIIVLLVMYCYIMGNTLLAVYFFRDTLSSPLVIHLPNDAHSVQAHLTLPIRKSNRHPITGVFSTQSQALLWCLEKLMCFTKTSSSQKVCIITNKNLLPSMGTRRHAFSIQILYKYV